MAIKKKDGSSQVTRLALDRKAQSERIAAVAGTHAKAIEAEAKKLLGDAAAKNLQTLVLALGTHVTALGDDLVASEHAHAVELSDDDAPRQQRDAAEAELRAAIVELQEIFTGLYGSAFVVRVKLSGTPPKNPKDLPEWIAPAVNVLAEIKASDFPKSRVADAKPEVKKWHATLAGPLESLRTALNDVLREESEAVETLARRNESLDRFDTFAPRAEALLSALLRFVGRDAEADRIPTPDRARAKASDPTPTPDPNPDNPPPPPK